MPEKAISWLVDKRNNLFILMCSIVHVFLLILFLVLNIWGMVALNIFSSFFYMFFVIIKKDFSENVIVYSYFEIIIFATISTILLGRQAGFILYIVGMISVVFYLSYHHGAKRFLYQGIGATIVILLVVMEPVIDNYFVEYKRMVEPYSRLLYIINLVVTLATVVIVSFLYAMEIDRMNKEINDINKRLDYQATHDELTGLINRYEMNRHIDNILTERKDSLFVAMMDVDDFKKMNDSFGHYSGDYVLKSIANMMDKYLKDFHVARWGGEEFLVISDNLSKEDGLKKIEKFHNAVRKMELQYKGNKLNVHLTIGVTFGDDVNQINHLILEADNRLYIGKSGTKDCIICEG